MTFAPGDRVRVKEDATDDTGGMVGTVSKVDYSVAGLWPFYVAPDPGQKFKDGTSIDAELANGELFMFDEDELEPIE